MTQELYKKHRPRKLKDIIGQPEAVNQLYTMLKQNSVPHAILFAGNTGCGKTTMARILARRLTGHTGEDDNCLDITEINGASSRGIDTVREIEMKYTNAALGKCRVWIIDECFHGGTLVSTCSGKKEIRSIRVGEKIYNISGIGKVKNKFVNKVPVDRLVRLWFDDGSSIFTTKEHEFLTKEGWLEAQSLPAGGSLFCDPAYTTCKEVCHEEKVYTGGNLRFLQKGVRKEHKSRKIETEFLLFEKLRYLSSREKDGSWGYRNPRLQGLRSRVSNKEGEEGKVLQSELPGEVCTPNKAAAAAEADQLFGVWKGDDSHCHQDKDVLWQVLPSKKQIKVPGVSRENLLRRSKGKNKQRPFQIGKDRIWEEAGRGEFQKNDREQSGERSFCHGKDEENEGRERNFACLVGYEGWKWRVHETTDSSLGKARGSGRRLETGSFHSDWLLSRAKRFPIELQSRCWEQGKEVGYRGRWERASDEKRYLKRCEKDKEVRRVRLDRVEVYQPGHNDQDFLGVVSDTDRARGYVEFYDLEVSGNPSYFANGVAVHNCHHLVRRKGGDAQTAMLKLLEDTPKHVYFLMCTTDPDALLPTFRNRCTFIKVNPLSDEDMRELVKEVLTKEGKQISDKVLEELVGVSSGSARQVLVVLDQILNLGSEEDQLSVILKEDTKKQSWDLVKALIWGKNKWPDIVTIINQLGEQDWEGLRKLVLANAATSLLKGGRGSGNAYFILVAFEGSFMYSGRGGFVRACYEAINHPDRDKG